MGANPYACQLDSRSENQILLSLCSGQLYAPLPFSQCPHVVILLLVTLSHPSHCNILVFNSLAGSVMWSILFLVGNLFHFVGSPCKVHFYINSCPLSSISLFKVAQSFKYWLKAYSYLSKGVWCKELKCQLLENQGFCLTHTGQWS